MRKKTRKNKKGWSWSAFKKDERTTKISGVLFVLSAIYLSVAFVSYFYTWQIDQDKVLRFSWSILWQGDLSVSNWLGRLGAVVSNLFFYWGFGLPSLFVIAVLFRMGFNKLRNIPIQEMWIWTRNIGIITLFSSILLEYIFTSSAFPWGGAFGESSCIWLTNFIGQIGLGILLTFSMIIFFIWTVNPDLKNLEYAIAGLETRFSLPTIDWKGLGAKLKFINPLNAELAKDADMMPPAEQDWQDTVNGESPKEQRTSQEPNASTSISQTNDIELDNDLAAMEITAKEKPNLQTELEINIPTETPSDANKDSEQNVINIGMEPVLHIKEENRDHSEPYDPTADLSSYRSPSLDLLIDYQSDFEVDRTELEAKKNQILETLSNYKIEIKKIKATVGPTVTLYEIVPAQGIRISKIKSLEDDIALSLSALGIRIIAPIPGKGTIGIEVPNKKRQVVSLKEILKSDKFQNAKMDLPIALGKTITNEVFVADLAKMPHLLIAGATGQGKSVGINAVLMSLLYKKHPSQVKLVLIDPKKVELPIYNDLDKHFLAFLPDQEEAIITDTTKVIHTLNSLCIEMDDRYDLLKKARARNIKEYNVKFTARKLNPKNGHRFLPFIVLVIDEFADLIMTAGKEIELPIARLAQLARAIGIHLIIATQRPSVKIITGHIKANFPARIAFRVTSLIDSKTILDHKGAEQLIGKGDMLLSAGSDVVRLQCAFVDTPEVEEVIKSIADQRGYSEPYYLPEYKGDDADLNGGGLQISDLDSNFEECARLVITNQHGSTSMLQRRLQLGYNRAGRIMDQLESLNIVGPSNGSKPREVMVFNVEEFDHMMTQLKNRK